MFSASFTGRCTRDAEVRDVKGGRKVLDVTIATDVGYGDYKHTDYIKVSLWDNRATGLAPYLKKGKAVAVSCKGIYVREYAKKDGGTGFELVAELPDIELTGSKLDNETPAVPTVKPKANYTAMKAEEPEPIEGADEDSEMPF